MVTEFFHAQRLPAITARLALLARTRRASDADEPEEYIQLLEHVYDREVRRRTCCIGVNWDIMPKADLLAVAEVGRG